MLVVDRLRSSTIVCSFPFASQYGVWFCSRRSCLVGSLGIFGILKEEPSPNMPLFFDDSSCGFCCCAPFVSTAITKLSDGPVCCTWFCWLLLPPPPPLLLNCFICFEICCDSLLVVVDTCSVAYFAVVDTCSAIWLWVVANWYDALFL